jgi:aminoglycoside phosphotransferase (APT) family kinase protein
MGQEWIDRSKPVRAGEELDADKLAEYFQKNVPEIAGPIEISQFPSGFSNLTYLLAAGGKEYVLRRPPFGNKVKSAHDMGREFRVLSRLNGVYSPAPRAMVMCEDLDVMGVPFYVMERRRGVILRQSSTLRIVRRQPRDDAFGRLRESGLRRSGQARRLRREASEGVDGSLRQSEDR